MIDCVFKQLLFNLKVWILLKRATEKLTMDQLTKRRGHDREQQRKYRESKKMNKPTVINISYLTPVDQSKSKLILKVLQLQTILSKLLFVISLIKTVFEEVVTTVHKITLTNYLNNFKYFTMTRSPFISG